LDQEKKLVPLNKANVPCELPLRLAKEIGLANGTGEPIGFRGFPDMLHTPTTVYMFLMQPEWIAHLERNKNEGGSKSLTTIHTFECLEKI
jgi:hypothetical protein